MQIKRDRTKYGVHSWYQPIVDILGDPQKIVPPLEFEYFHDLRERREFFHVKTPSKGSKPDEEVLMVVSLHFFIVIHVWNTIVFFFHHDDLKW